MKFFATQTSQIDYVGNYSLVAVSPGCNYRCPACHAKDIIFGQGEISEEQIINQIRSNNWIDAIVLSGGEPALQTDILHFLRDLRKLAIKIKLDTNGSMFDVLEQIARDRLVDYVAMDVKACPELYSQVAGRRIDLRDDVEKGLVIATRFPEYELRTTIVPVVRDDKISFMTPEEIGDMAMWIAGRTGRNEHRLYLQEFVPRKDGLINPELEDFPKTPRKLLESCLIEARKHLPDTRIR